MLWDQSNNLVPGLFQKCDHTPIWASFMVFPSILSTVVLSDMISWFRFTSGTKGEEVLLLQSERMHIYACIYILYLLPVIHEIYPVTQHSWRKSRQQRVIRITWMWQRFWTGGPFFHCHSNNVFKYVKEVRSYTFYPVTIRVCSEVL